MEIYLVTWQKPIQTAQQIMFEIEAKMKRQLGRGLGEHNVRGIWNTHLFLEHVTFIFLTSINIHYTFILRNMISTTMMSFHNPEFFDNPLGTWCPTCCV